MQNEDGWTPLHEACCLGLADVVEALLQHGADARARCKDGTTPLHKAARAGSKAAVAMLMQAGADVSAVDKVYCTPRALGCVCILLQTVGRCSCLGNAIPCACSDLGVWLPIRPLQQGDTAVSGAVKAKSVHTDPG